MFGIPSITLYIYIAIGVAIAGLAGTVWFLHHENGSLHEKIGQQEILMKELQATVQALQNDAKLVKENTQELFSKTNKLREDFDKSARVIIDHNFGAIGAKHPRLLESRANNATRDFLKRLEESSR
jgi:uncharacterized protein YoxC